MKYTAYRNAKYISLDKTRINCELKTSQFGWLPYTLDKNDKDNTVDNEVLLKQMLEYNNIAPFEPPSFEVLLQEAKALKKAEIERFYKTTAVLLTIRNGATQPALANQDFTNDLISAINQAEMEPDGMYTHYVIREDGKLQLDDNLKPIKIKISLETLNIILKIVDARRGYCYKYRQYNIAVVDALHNIDDVNNYNFLYNDEGEPYQDFKPIMLDISGNIIQ